jgi:hypothetical protein
VAKAVFLILATTFETRVDNLGDLVLHREANHHRGFREV